MKARASRKRGSEAATDQPQKRRKQGKDAANTLEEGLDMLPHNLGPASATTAHIKSEVDEAPESHSSKKGHKLKKEEPVHEPKDLSNIQQFDHFDEVGSTSRRTLRPRRAAGKATYLESDDEKPDVKTSARTTAKSSGTPKKKPKKEVADEDEAVVAEKTPRKTSKKTKANPYGLTPGITPFPDWAAPSAADCEEVYNLLAKVHGQAKAPKKIPAPSLKVSGCGEVPSVLDAMIRTRLSAHTSAGNSNAAFKGLVDKFGVVKEGVGKGSVDWDKVRVAPVGNVVEAIKCGGLAQIKGKDIKAILEMVHEENKSRRDAFLAEKKTGKAAEILGAEEKTQGQKDLEILKVEQGVLSLDHVHGMHPDQAMQALVKFPGVGVKTASCVILFCLQQPSFAVDTHVHRLSGWLKWIPPKASRDETFSHLEVRIPDHLKYGLHKLFVTHGRNCLRCRANTSEGTEEWEDSVCPLEGVIDRVGKRQSSGKGNVAKKKKVHKDEDDSS
ncbi:hypothetical protein G7046_g7609 [Stylonectria norvegica]|nr:hypothetical protein G7046_g7609 [Stylonectria norvegica]